MEFRNLYSFLRVAEVGNFTRAAEEMGYAQSTVTAQIQQLENELGVPLFERIGKKNMLTIYGQQLIMQANQILQSVERMKALGESDPMSIQATLRIGIVESLLSSLLLEVVGTFRETYPNLSLQIRLGVTTELFELLRHNEVDLIFTIGDHWDTKDCECAASHREQAVFFAAKGHPFIHTESLSLNEVLKQPLILTGEKTFLYQELSKLAFHYGKELKPCIQTDSAKVIVDMVNQDLGISLLPEYLVRHTPFSRHYGLKVLPVEDFSMTFYTRVFHHRNKWLTPQMLGLLELVEEYWRAFDARQAAL